MKTKTYLLLLVNVLCICSINLKSQTIFSSTHNTIYKINLSDCSTDSLCFTEPEGMMDIAFCNGVLYGTNNGNIFSIDTITGYQSIVYNSNYPNFNSMVGDENSNLFLACMNSENIYKYDLINNILTNIGDIGKYAEGDITLKDNFLYLITSNDILTKITISPFSYVVIDTLNLDTSTSHAVFGLVTIKNLDSSSTLYASSFENDLNTNITFQIDENDATTTITCSSLPEFGGNPVTGLANTTNKPQNINDFYFANQFNIYPNPVERNFTVSVPISTQEINIYNSIGCLIQTRLIKEETNLSFNLNNTGIYFIQIITDKQILTKKVIVTN